NNLSSGKGELLHIGASLTIGEYLLPEVLGKFQKNYKQFEFSLTIGNTPTILSKLENSEIDVALVEGIAENKKFQIEKFAEDELILIIPNNHQWKDHKEIPIEALVQERILLRERTAGVRKIIDTLLAKHNILDQIQSYIELGSTQAII